MGRKPCCSKESVKKGTWSSFEDQILSNYIDLHGEGNWRDLPRKAGLKRCGKSCRLRWVNYLKPGIKRGDIAEDEEDLIIRLHKLLGNRWSLIAGRLPGRTDNEIKNYWNTHINKRAKGGKNQQPQNIKPMKRNEETSNNVIVKPTAVRYSGEVIKTPLVTIEIDNLSAINNPKTDTVFSSSATSSTLEDLVLGDIGKDLELEDLDITNNLQWKLDFNYLELEEMNFELDQMDGFNGGYTWP